MAWSDLPVDLLRCISSLLPIVDFLRFSSACTSWNSVLANNALIRVQCRPSPWCLFPSEASDTLTFHDITIEDIHSRDIHHHFSSINSYISFGRCIGSKDGWIVTLDGNDQRVHLFNPITKAVMSLPSLSTLPKNRINPRNTSIFFEQIPRILAFGKESLCAYIRKIVVSSNNSSGTALVIYDHKRSLALAKPGDLAWVLGPPLPRHPLDDNDDEFDDIYFNDEEQLFYAITNFSAVLAFNHDGRNVKLICPAIYSQYVNRPYQRNYIGFLSGTLIKIERSVCHMTSIDRICRTMKNKIIILKFVQVNTASSCSNSQWIPIKDLEDYSLFVGCNQTFSIHHTIVPEIRPNCIYFADHCDYNNRNVGLYDLHSDCSQYFLETYFLNHWSHSTWFTPSFS